MDSLGGEVSFRFGLDRMVKGQGDVLFLGEARDISRPHHGVDVSRVCPAITSDTKQSLSREPESE